MPQKMNPPYAGRRTAEEAAYKVGGVKEARRLASAVVPAKAGTYPPCPSLRAGGQKALCSNQSGGPCFRSEDKYHHTAILRCRTGAPAVRLSAASEVALASVPWGRERPSNVPGSPKCSTPSASTPCPRTPPSQPSAAG